MNRQDVLTKIRAAFKNHLGANSKKAKALVPQSVLAGKLYEAFVLSEVVERLKIDEGYFLQLTHGRSLRLKMSPGPINRQYPHIDLIKNGKKEAELWTDVEFLSLSYSKSPTRIATRADYHELDIIITDPDIPTRGRPSFSQIWLGIECKNISVQKNKDVLRSILGVRREMSLLQGSQTTRFSKWPQTEVPADPSSCLVVFCSDYQINDFTEPGKFFGIRFIHLPM